ncbi:MAG: tRNA pseudouridine(38-40) synthase TruA [Micavibrio aeruginosavorus]|uniref:tRNA pseudouridine synthase A n=1 Tax=Micavibrio aeruginosavorus TaxID=349221 RepID=A0A2W5BQD9_9BACT|nr:MAG: tRNA pseudouridine(38-40) synthase TruA [Micavibrio aeruginosavorus]
MQRWKLTIEYDGQPFSGWQHQDHAPSVQEAIETAIFKFCGQKLRLHVAGRTDAGVHARGQVAHFDLDYGTRALSGFDLAKAINAHLKPRPVAILKAEEVPEDFHARFSAKNKFYCYRILNRTAPLALEQGKAWSMFYDLDADAMHDAAQILLGTHDFTTFRDSECQGKSPIKSVNRLDVIRRGEDIFFEVEGRSFLHHQVRNMVGTLVLVGRGKWNNDDFRAALDAKDRTKGGMTAPAAGLYLMRVDY